jgi:DNA (cytosine-5)-methyltransferase 1
MPQVISVFCGCGGFDLGFSRAGFDIGLALDIDPVVVNTYNQNRESVVARERDLATLTGDELVALYESLRPGEAPVGLIGGPPCQSFSRGNVHFDAKDIKYRLPRHFAELLRAVNAAYSLDFFVFENVHGITYEKHRDTFADFKRLFRKAGFHLFEGMLDAIDFGVAQHRPRVFVVGINKVKYPELSYIFPEPFRGRRRTVGQAIIGLPPAKYFERGLESKDIPYHPNHWTMRPISRKFSDGSLKEGERRGRSFRVLSWNKPSWTVAYGNREIHIHPSGTRRLTVYEAMRLQGFPRKYQLHGNLSQQVSQVSDAIPPQLGWVIGRAIQAQLYPRNDAHAEVDP